MPQANLIARVLNYRNNYTRIVEIARYEKERAQDKLTLGSLKMLKQRPKLKVSHDWDTTSP
jgi:hypothetical protein